MSVDTKFHCLVNSSISDTVGRNALRYLHRMLLAETAVIVTHWLARSVIVVWGYVVVLNLLGPTVTVALLIAIIVIEIDIALIRTFIEVPCN